MEPFESSQPTTLLKTDAKYRPSGNFPSTTVSTLLTSSGEVDCRFFPTFKLPLIPQAGVIIGLPIRTGGGSQFGLYNQTSVSWGASVDPHLDYLSRNPINPPAAARRVFNEFLSFRRRERFRIPSKQCNPIFNPLVHRR